VQAAAAALAEASLPANIMIDFSHANSMKEFRRQIDVGSDVASQIAGGDRRIIGVMIESNLKAGNQKLVPGETPAYGVSITDACIGWDDSVPVIESLADAVASRRRVRVHS
jgi:3-deoxy-7-phosphoheptulonate synthase